MHQLLSNSQWFDAIGGKHAALRTTIENDPRCAEAWEKEVNGLLASGNLEMMDIKDVPRGYKAIGYSGAFKHKYNHIKKPNNTQVLVQGSRLMDSGKSKAEITIQTKQQHQLCPWKLFIYMLCFYMQQSVRINEPEMLIRHLLQWSRKN